MNTIDAATREKALKILERKFGHDAEDVLQDALLGFMMLPERPREPLRWISGRAWNRGLSAWRCHQRRGRRDAEFARRLDLSGGSALPDARLGALQVLDAVSPERRRWLLEAASGTEPVTLKVDARDHRRRAFRQSIDAAQAA